MDERPVYLGRGRGRASTFAGAAKDAGPQSFAHGRGRGNSHNTFSGTSAPKEETRSAEERFSDASAKIKASVNKHLNNLNEDSSSSDEDDDGEYEHHGAKILDSMVKSFPGGQGDGDASILGNTYDVLLNYFKSGSNVCLICIESIKKTEAVWSCTCCYCIFHIQCIQKWVKDGVYQQTALSEENFPNRDLPWFCPKCRNQYEQSECPTKYMCFCGKLCEPKFDPWLPPHSCGETCGKALKPSCGHSCVLPCHPGPCPPCPKTVNVSCHCGQHSPLARRCGAKAWSCGKPCSRLLACGHHECTVPCHEWECPPCLKTSDQKCLCGKNETSRECSSPDWQCEEVCTKVLSCGNHTCEEVCHAGKCGPCPRSVDRKCPCGKSSSQLPCTEDVPTCGDTCEKPLECGLHLCAQRCHYGPCGTCREMMIKRCRCGARQKEVQCYKDYQCETRCNKMKDCGRHQCKKKCCDGKCPPCDQQCGRHLGCKNHKCKSRCHTGRCYPCPLTVQVKCFCGHTVVKIPCGREKTTPPPRCRGKCKIPPTCHHPSREPHRCHFGNCPPCRQTCDKDLPECDHKCPSSCHSGILAKVQDKVVRSGPWEKLPPMRVESIDKPCPPCQVPIQAQCLGKHETCYLPCSEVKPFSCTGPCGRKLPCGNHSCRLECHEVVGAKDSMTSGKNCALCEEPCSKPRAPGCGHGCLLPCHPEDCPSCCQMIRMRCHCQIVVRHIECYKWIESDESMRDDLKACGGPCPKTLACGHHCTLTCHPGDCASSEKCRENTPLRCQCRRRKKNFPCCEVRSGKTKLPCDEACEKQKESKKKAAEEAEQAKKDEELRKQQKELEDFERKMKGRGRHRPRKQREVVEEAGFCKKYWKYFLAAIIVLALSVGVTLIAQS
ncbi:NF-X1-type zinc finger protein NFXL1-like [Lineus longissimus]|uniref:NF-X1-type zinc finger protein NFXL1-like n=1 Tax=Lineus longissimus TaxID=88925 RepID=UPI002B4F7B11